MSNRKIRKKLAKSMKTICRIEKKIEKRKDEKALLEAKLGARLEQGKTLKKRDLRLLKKSDRRIERKKDKKGLESDRYGRLSEKLAA